MSRNDFHNGRSYADDALQGSGGVISWLKGWAQRTLRKAVAPTAIPPIAPSRDKSPYSLLGTSEQDIEPNRSGTPVFPMTDWATRSPAPPHRRRTGRSRPVGTGLQDQDR